jgi:hypothetical protein
VFLKAASALPGHPTRPALSIAKHISRLLGGVWLAAGLAPGCSGERPEPAIVRDSAGVRIVEIAAPVWDEGSAWTLAAEPSLRLGATEGNAAQEFGRIRGVLRLTDGRIVIADGTSNEIRIFSSRGELVRTEGGQGSGPGEFQLLWSLRRFRGNAFVAWDWRTSAVSYYAPDGSFFERLAINAITTGGAELAGAFEDGGLLFMGSYLRNADRDGVNRSTALFTHVDPGTGRADSVAALPDYELDVVLVEGRVSMTTEIPYSHDVLYATAPDRFYAGANDRFEIEQRMPDGTLVQRIRYPAAEHAIAPEEAQRLEEEVIGYVNPSPDRRRNIERLFREIERPPLRPAFSGMIVDADGNLWVADWVSGFAPPQHTPERWYVFDADGRLLGEVAMPAGYRPHDIGSGWLIGVTKDELEVEYVEVYELRKQP